MSREAWTDAHFHPLRPLTAVAAVRAQCGDLDCGNIEGFEAGAGGSPHAA